MELIPETEKEKLLDITKKRTRTVLSNENRWGKCVRCETGYCEGLDSHVASKGVNRKSIYIFLATIVQT